MGVEEAFRKSLFQVASLHTSTGFATADYMTWPSVLWGTLTVIMIIGACAGSTTGGMKCIRLLILAKISRNEFKHITGGVKHEETFIASFALGGYGGIVSFGMRNTKNVEKRGNRGCYLDERFSFKSRYE